MYPVKILWGTSLLKMEPVKFGGRARAPPPMPLPHGPPMFVIDSKISDLIANKLICQSRLSPIVVRLYL